MAQNYSTTLTATPAQIIPPAGLAERDFVSITNVAATGGGTAWLSNFTTSPAPNAPGSYPIAPGQSMVFSGYAPTGAVWGVASAGSVPVTVEVSVA
nr:hypothetical protein [uncultured Lichenicoccus sp.]